MEQELLAQETRRQAMLQVMGLDVWLPRQQLPYAPASAPYLLSWQPQTETSVPAAAVAAAETQQQVGSQPPATPAATVVAQPVSSASVQASLQQVRESLGAAPAKEPETVAQTDAVEQPAVVQKVAIPRFSVQLLRSGSCLLLADLPLGEAFQSSDPDFQLLGDIVRAAGLPQAPQLLRQGEPIRWPLLTTGQLAGSQDAAAARACVRDLLEYECSHAQVSFVWLLGQRAMTFANCEEDADADLFAVTAFQAGVRFWNLPSLEQLMSDKQLKPQLWQHMQKLMAHWSQPA